jgi:hypothetical protein
MQTRSYRRHLALACGTAGAATLAVFALQPGSGPRAVTTPARAEEVPAKLPAPPANGRLGFVIERFVQPVVQGKDACPDGTALKLKDEYLAGLPETERARLKLKENEAEFTKLWQAASFGPNGTNVCSQPDTFTRPPMRTVQSKVAWGLNLDQDGKDPDSCAHDTFTDPHGQSGIDNQEYRVMGCTLEWRGVDGIAGDQQVGMQQFLNSGEWTQVILLEGVDSLVHDDNVTVILANTPDRPMMDNKGHFLTGASFTVSDRAPRNRNVLHGRIDNGVLTTDPTDIKLAETWGQGGARDIRGNRTKWEYRKGRLRLTFQPDGTLTGLMGGYRPVFDVFASAAIGGAGSAVVAGIDCAQELQTLRAMADGLKDPKTGKCTGVSSAIQIKAVPAFVNDIPTLKTSGTATR